MFVSVPAKNGFQSKFIRTVEIYTSLIHHEIEQIKIWKRLYLHGFSLKSFKKTIIPENIHS